MQIHKRPNKSERYSYQEFLTRDSHRFTLKHRKYKVRRRVWAGKTRKRLRCRHLWPRFECKTTKSTYTSRTTRVVLCKCKTVGSTLCFTCRRTAQGKYNGGPYSRYTRCSVDSDERWCSLVARYTYRKWVCLCYCCCLTLETVYRNLHLWHAIGLRKLLDLQRQWEDAQSNNLTMCSIFGL